ncbi:MAG: hypothetical protein KJZ64_06475 [Sphingomonadaceae bacterium]|nr:hypothetical protein [Sphingomonadaceae bacterium]
MTRTNPALATTISKSNGEAASRLVGALFTGRLAETKATAKAAASLQPLANQALASTPLSPQAIAVRAAGATDPAQKAAILDAARAINRRDPLLQGLVLEQSLARKDYPAVLSTLDSLLRVQPEQGSVLFPVLEQALESPQTVSEFARILDGTAPWHIDFVRGAVRKPELRANLAQVRLRTGLSDPGFDNQLMAVTAASGDLEVAGKLYRHVAGKPLPAARLGAIDWNSALPPFDWALATESGFHASPDPSGKRLEVLIRAGKGGRIAGRLMANPGVPFAVAVGPGVGPFAKAEDFQLVVRCPGNGSVLADARIGKIREETLVAVRPAPPGECAFLSLELMGRAWRGEGDARGELEQLRLVAR